MLNAIQPNLICLMRIYDLICVVVSVPETNQLKIMINYVKIVLKHLHLCLVLRTV